MLGFPVKGRGPAVPGEVLPVAENPAAPIDYPKVEGALDAFHGAAIEGAEVRASKAERAVYEGLGKVHATLASAMVWLERARQALDLGQLDAAKLRAVYAIERWDEFERLALESDGPIVNPSEPAEVAAGCDEYVLIHWGVEPSEVRKVRRSELSAIGPLVEVGRLFSVDYETRKGKDREPTLYHHVFGSPEGSGDLPGLAEDSTHRLFIVGGAYTVTERGIEG